MSRPASAALPTGTPQYELRSDLASYCLPTANRDETRNLAWAVSICVLFLAASIINLLEPQLLYRSAPPAPDRVVAFLPPLIEPEPPRAEEKILEAHLEDPRDEIEELEIVAPVVVARPQDVTFAVPVEGQVVVSTNARFVPPPPPIIPRTPPPAGVAPLVRALRFGDKAFRKQPPPDYPPEFERNRIGGVVEILFSVGTNGEPQIVEASRSSGTPALDRHVCEFIRQEWRAFPGEAAKYRIAITFKP
jgi:TonB family protein